MITLKSTYDALKADFDKLTAECETLKKELETVKANPTNAEAMQAELDAAKTALETTKAELVTLTENYAKVVEENTKLKEDKTTLEELAANKAVEIVSSQGVPPLSVKPVSQPSSTTLENDIVGQYMAITDRAKQREFWTQHRDELSAMLKPSKR